MSAPRRSQPSRPRRPSVRGGFTLFEVLAAVGVLGLVYVVLAGVAIQNLRASGDTERRLRASLLADRALAALEAELEAGLAPEPGETEEEEDEAGYVLRTRVSPLETPPVEEALLAPRLPSGERLPTVLAPAAPDAPPPLLQIELSVSWYDGVAERSVRRTTYAFNAAAVEPYIEALEARNAEGAQGPGAGGTEGPEAGGAEGGRGPQAGRPGRRRGPRAGARGGAQSGQRPREGSPRVLDARS